MMPTSTRRSLAHFQPFTAPSSLVGLARKLGGLEAFVVFLKFRSGLAFRYCLPQSYRIESLSISGVCDLLFGGPLGLDHLLFTFSPSSTLFLARDCGCGCRRQVRRRGFGCRRGASEFGSVRAVSSPKLGTSNRSHEFAAHRRSRRCLSYRLGFFGRGALNDRRC
jgi:hypothetical protein